MDVAAKKVFILAPEIHPPFIEGVQKTAWSFAREFVRQGCEVEIATAQSYGERFSEALVEGVRIGYWFSTYRIRLFKYLLWFFDAFNLVRHIRKIGSRQLIVFSLDLPFFFPLAFLSLFSRQERVTLSIFSWRELNGVGRIFLKLFGRLIDRYVVRSDFMKKELEMIGVKEENIDVIIPFPNKEKFLAVDPGVRVPGSIAYLSNVDESAGAPLMLDLAQKMPKMRVVIAVRRFDDAYERAVDAYARDIERRSIENIQLVRTIEDVPLFLRQTEIVVLPVVDMASTMDLPMVLIEALASGCRVFVRRLPLFAGLAKEGCVEDFETVEELVVKLSTVRPQGQQEAARRFVEALPSVSESAHHYLS